MGLSSQMDEGQDHPGKRRTWLNLGSPRFRERDLAHHYKRWKSSHKMTPSYTKVACTSISRHISLDCKVGAESKGFVYSLQHYTVNNDTFIHVFDVT